MTLTKKHFKQFAESLLAIKPQKHNYRSYSEYIVCERVWFNSCSATADVLQNLNPRFDREEFLDACEA